LLADSTFSIQPLPQIVFGRGVAGRMPEHLQRAGLAGRSVLIATDPGLVAAGLVDPVARALEGAGHPVAVFPWIDANPTDRNVVAGAEVLRELAEPFVLALGGGSAMDAAKAIALLGPNAGGLDDIVLGRQPARPGAPVVAIPTTAGTGSETNMFAVITDTTAGRKRYVAHPSVQPRLTLLDPEVTIGLPPYPTATCGMDVLTHAIEAFTARGATPYSDGVALAAIEAVGRWLPRAVDEGTDVEARARMLLASNMAAIAFNVAGLGACHATGHPLSARLHAPHGQTLATMLPHVMAENADVCAVRYARVAVALGAAKSGADDAANARAAIDAVCQLRSRVGVERTIRELGGSPERIPQLVEDALADMILVTNPKPLSAAQLTRLYEAAMG
jgi:alcohol dehydrogenase